MRGQMTHLDTDVLAEFRAGLITGRRGAKIAAHLAGCDRCTALDDKLAGVSVLLASVPAPPMPDSVAQRLEVVLAAEVTGKNYPERGQVDRPGESGAHDRPGAKRGFRLATWRVLVPVGAAVVLLAGGGYGLSLIAHSPRSQTTASAAAGSTSSSAAGSAGKSASSNSVPAAAAPPVSGGAAGRRERSPAHLSVRVAISGTDFVSAKPKLEQQLKAALSAPEGTTHIASTQTRGCVQNVAGNASLIRVYSAHFQGRAATIIVARKGQDDTAWVVGPGCSAASRDLLATVTLPPGISGP
jgi:hypothetical protein